MTPTTLVPRPVAPAADLEQQEQRVPGDRARHQQGASAAARIWVKLLGPPSEVIMARAPTTTSPHRAPTTIATSSDTSSLSRLAAPPASTATIKPSGKTIRSGKRVAAGIAAPMIPMPAMSASVGPPGWAPSTAHPAPQEAINIPALPTATESRRFCASVPRTNWVRNIRMIPTPRPGATQSRLGPPGPQSPNSVAAVETTKITNDTGSGAGSAKSRGHPRAKIASRTTVTDGISHAPAPERKPAPINRARVMVPVLKTLSLTGSILPHYEHCATLAPPASPRCTGQKRCYLGASAARVTCRKCDRNPRQSILSTYASIQCIVPHTGNAAVNRQIKQEEDG